MTSLVSSVSAQNLNPSVASQVDLFFSIARNLSSDEIASERKKIKVLLMEGFTIDKDYFVAGRDKSWPRLNKKGFEMQGLTIIKRGRNVYGNVTLAQYLDRLIAYGLHSLRMEFATESALNAFLSAPASTKSQNKREAVSDSDSDSEETGSGDEFALTLLRNWAAKGGRVILSVVPESKDDVPCGDNHK